ncbi:hypothetical protein GAB14E_1426 [Colwellia psychrerythraea]|uniref:Uncharacterized protein n=1 Tax=Colwellia psychrerythraea TaxID=28229 RepID=A0A099L4Z6_COLPS|nr:hypothetical protein GAB14E_1426 [Colwellia psychrerythraea]
MSQYITDNSKIEGQQRLLDWGSYCIKQVNAE